MWPVLRRIAVHSGWSSVGLNTARRKRTLTSFGGWTESGVTLMTSSLVQARFENALLHSSYGSVRRSRRIVERAAERPVVQQVDQRSAFLFGSDPRVGSGLAERCEGQHWWQLAHPSRRRAPSLVELDEARGLSCACVHHLSERSAP